MQKIFYIFILEILFISSTGKTQEPHFTCVFEKDHNPPISKQANAYYQKAIQNYWPSNIADIKATTKNYQNAIDLGDWRAMNNMAERYNIGVISIDDIGRKFDIKSTETIATGVPKNLAKARKLYQRMIDMNVPLGYYQWAKAIDRGDIKPQGNRDYLYFIKRSAELGYPMAQVTLGNYYFRQFPKDKDKNYLAEQYIKCAAKQNDTAALVQIGHFYRKTKQNYPLAAFYYQRAASLGSSMGIRMLMFIFTDPSSRNIYIDIGYKPDINLATIYYKMLLQRFDNSNLNFPNLIKDHPLPRHPTQGYDADHPDTRPSE